MIPYGRHCIDVDDIESVVSTSCLDDIATLM